MLFRKLKQHTTAQAMIEFVFTMIAMTLLILGMIKVFAWTGKDLVARQKAHMQGLEQEVCNDSACVLKQLQPSFYTSTGFDATVDSDIYEESGFLAPPGTYTGNP